MPRPEYAPPDYGEQQYRNSDFDPSNQRPEILHIYPLEPRLEVYDTTQTTPPGPPIESTFYRDPISGKIIIVDQTPAEKIPEAA